MIVIVVMAAVVVVEDEWVDRVFLYLYCTYPEGTSAASDPIRDFHHEREKKRKKKKEEKKKEGLASCAMAFLGTAPNSSYYGLLSMLKCSSAGVWQPLCLGAVEAIQGPSPQQGRRRTALAGFTVVSYESARGLG